VDNKVPEKELHNSNTAVPNIKKPLDTSCNENDKSIERETAQKANIDQNSPTDGSTLVESTNSQNPQSVIANAKGNAAKKANQDLQPQNDLTPTKETLVGPNGGLTSITGSFRRHIQYRPEVLSIF
jgi:hypothetical protein